MSPEPHDGYLPAEALNCDPCYGTLMLNGVLMTTPAWCLFDMSALWRGPDQRGSDGVLVPHLRGLQPRRRRLQATRYSLPLLITGQVDVDGLPWWQSTESPEHRLELNLQHLNDRVLLPRSEAVANYTGDGTVVMIWTLPSGSTRVRDATVLPSPAAQLDVGAIMRTTLELVVPGGNLFI